MAPACGAGREGRGGSETGEGIVLGRRRERGWEGEGAERLIGFGCCRAGFRRGKVTAGGGLGVSLCSDRARRDGIHIQTPLRASPQSFDWKTDPDTQNHRPPTSNFSFSSDLWYRY